MENNINEQAGLSKKQQRRLEKLQEKQANASSRATRKTSGRILFWVVILGIIGLFVWGIASLATAPTTVDGTKVELAVGPNDHVQGDPASKAVLVEYADFQCPACANYHPLIKQVKAAYPENLAVVYRHFPLPQHPHAKPMAYASEAAAKQGKFWEMHDLIFTNQSKWSTLRNVDETIESYAKQLNLDIEQFNTDRASKEVKDRVSADYDNGVGFGVNATPTFFLNGARLSNMRNLDDFKARIDTILAATPTSDAPSVQ